jgi:hypothetical protein
MKHPQRWFRRKTPQCAATVEVKIWKAGKEPELLQTIITEWHFKSTVNCNNKISLKQKDINDCDLRNEEKNVINSCNDETHLLFRGQQLPHFASTTRKLRVRISRSAIWNITSSHNNRGGCRSDNALQPIREVLGTNLRPETLCLHRFLVVFLSKGKVVPVLN